MAIEIKQSYPTVLAGCLSGRVVAYWVLGERKVLLGGMIYVGMLVKNLGSEEPWFLSKAKY